MLFNEKQLLRLMTKTNVEGDGAKTIKNNFNNKKY
jgi:hypothetical protein